jgi:hypothetical protein
MRPEKLFFTDNRDFIIQIRFKRKNLWQRFKKGLKKTLTTRVTVREPPAGALLASKKKKAKPVTEVK